MNKGLFLAMAASCGAFLSIVATGGEALGVVQNLVTLLPL